MGYWRDLADYMGLELSWHTREGRARLTILVTLLLFGTGGIYALLRWLFG